MRPIYKSYVFTEREKDPIIHECADAFKEVSRNGSTLKSIENDGGPKAGTVANWFYGKTTRPQVTTVRAFLRAINRDLAIVDKVRNVPKRKIAETIATLPARRKLKRRKKNAK